MGDFINFLFDRYDRSVVVVVMERRRSKLHRHYYDPKRVGSYGGVAALRRVVPAERDVERWLSTQDAYTLHKPVRRHFKRRCVVVGGPNQQWQADLVDMSRLKAANDGTTFLLTVIDVFSKRAWCIPLKSKSAASLVAAFRRLLNDVNNNRPTTLQTDKGSEFLNRPLQRLLKEYGVHHFTTHNEETKASVVERFNRSLKTRMWRYFTKKQTIRYVDALQDFVRSYNDSYHRSIGMAPSAVNGANQETVVAAVVRARRWWYAQVSSRRSRAHQQGETSLRERLHGELDGRIVYDRRRAPFGSARLSIGRLARR